MGQRRNVMSMDGIEARQYFLRQTSYFSTQLPPYFNFEGVLKEAERRLEGRSLDYFCVADPQNYNDVNYRIFHNKGGEYAWRPLQLIHPAFYVDIVNHLTEERTWQRIKTQLRACHKLKHIVCASRFVRAADMMEDKPLEIVNWWHRMEQDSIKLALDYDYVAHTDITNCYEMMSESLLREALGEETGRYLGRAIRGMNGGDFQGIPQGSSMMDFIAEVALGYVDWKLANVLHGKQIDNDYLILRYRDDYRIFVRNPRVAEDITRILAQVLAKYGMKLNISKTHLYDDIITSSVKPDKIYWNERRSLLYINDSGEVSEPSLQRHLMAIRELSRQYPNSGSVQSALVDLYKKRIVTLERRPQNLDQLVSLTMDITVNNPRTFFVSAAILSRFIPLYNNRAGRKMLAKVRERMAHVPNKDYFEICLQRISIQKRREEPYAVPLCRLVYNPKVKIWNSEWLSFTMNDCEVVDSGRIATMEEVVPAREVDLFSPFESAD